jgi:hypothetical protein
MIADGGVFQVVMSEEELNRAQVSSAFQQIPCWLDPAIAFR